MLQATRTILASLSLALLALPGTGGATTIEQFDRMEDGAQAEYVAVMVDATENALRAEGRIELADSMNRLFTEVPQGETTTTGIGGLLLLIARARVANFDRINKDPNAKRLEVEHALALTLRKRDIEVPKNVMTPVFAAMAKFQPQTYQNFVASPPIEQRRIVALLARVAVPAYEIRARIKEQLSKPSNDPPIMTEELAALRTEFPSKGPQPGFGPVARAITAEHAKTPNKPGVFCKVLLHHVDATEARLNRKSQEIDARAIKMPN